jgi:hypothetical protein
MLRNKIKVMGRSANNLHVPASNLTKYKKGAHYIGSKIFNHFPNHIKCLVNEKRVFKKTLQKFLFDNVFYSIDEFLNFNVNNSNNFNNYHVLIVVIDDILINLLYCIIFLVFLYDNLS